MFKVINITTFCAIGFYNFVNLCAVNRFYYNKHHADAIVCISIKPNVNAIVCCIKPNVDAIGCIASNLMSMQYGLLHRTLAIAIEILIALNLLDVLHLHDFDAITFLHLSPSGCKTSMADAIATFHQNDFDAITHLHLSILMQETTDGRCNSELSHWSQQTNVIRLLHLELLHWLASNAKLMRYQAIASILALLHQKFAGAIESKISSGTRVLCTSL
jgi:hypothetical protein